MSNKMKVAEKPTGKEAAATDIVTHNKWIVSVHTAKQGKVSKGPPKGKKGSPQFLSAEGKFVIAADFEETPEDFDEYVE